MNQLLVLMFAVMTAAAMVPINRLQRAIPEDSVINQDSVSEKTSPMNATTTSTTPAPRHQEICARQTPCGWTVYKSITRIVDVFMPNPYCICSADLECLRTEDDTSVAAYVHRCRTQDEVADLVWDN